MVALGPYNNHKLEFITGRCIFISYSSHHKGYQCLHSSGKVYISNHVIFYEQSFPYQAGVDFSFVSNSCLLKLQSDGEIPHSVIQAFSVSPIAPDYEVHPSVRYLHLTLPLILLIIHLQTCHSLNLHLFMHLLNLHLLIIFLYINPLAIQ